MMGAKKLIWNTVFQSASSVSRVLSRAATGLLGADGGVVDERMELRALRLQLLASCTAMAAWVSAEEARSTMI